MQHHRFCQNCKQIKNLIVKIPTYSVSVFAQKMKYELNVISDSLKSFELNCVILQGLNIFGSKVDESRF